MRCVSLLVRRSWVAREGQQHDGMVRFGAQGAKRWSLQGHYVPCLQDAGRADAGILGVPDLFLHCVLWRQAARRMGPLLAGLPRHSLLRHW